ncbi:MAG: hypothetical protein KC457_30745, partial [Myxococcales bacterium]|nr:hypothetical protein [Myxococcales bacterium]
MELSELLEREGLEADALLDWARERAEQLIAEMAADDPLHGILEGRQVDVPVTSTVVSRTPAVENEAAGEAWAPEPIEDTPTSVVGEVELEHWRESDRRDAGVQPITLDELPPPPEHTGLADGEPEPMLE